MVTNFVTTIKLAFTDNPANNVQDFQKMSTWITSALNPTHDRDTIEGAAKEILTQLQATDPSTSKTRYKFTQMSAREEVLKIIFDRSFAYKPAAVITAAEALHPSKATFYPTWKKVCWIQIPKGVSAVLDIPLVKIALTVCTLYYAYVACYAAYEATVYFTARSLPFIINNTPIQIIRMGNRILDAKNWVFSHVWTILLYTWVGQQIVLMGPEIPHFTPAVRAVRIGAMFNMLVHSPQTVGGFVLNTAINAAAFTWNVCTEASNDLRGRAVRAEDARLAVCHDKAYEVWQSLVTA